MQTILNQCNTPLAKIIQHSQKLLQLEKNLKKHLPEQLTEYCRIANFNQGVLSLVVANGAWATQLRYQLPTLKAQLIREKDFANLTSIRCYVDSQLFNQHKQVQNNG